jgi:Peptidase M15
MKRLLTVALGVALCSLATAANARPSDLAPAHTDSYSSYSDNEGGYRSRRNYRRTAGNRNRRRHVARPGRRTAVRRGQPTPMAQRSITRFAGPGTSRGCLTGAAIALLGRIESQFGAVQVVSTCRPGARIAGTGRISRHASGNAIDFNAGGRKAAIVRWLIANHRSGGTMTYAGMTHVHVDIGPHFVALNSGGGGWR